MADSQDNNLAGRKGRYYTPPASIERVPGLVHRAGRDAFDRSRLRPFDEYVGTAEVIVAAGLATQISPVRVLGSPPRWARSRSDPANRGPVCTIGRSRRQTAPR